MFETVASILSTGLGGTSLAVIVTLSLQGQSWLHGKFEANLGYMKHCVK